MEENENQFCGCYMDEEKDSKDIQKFLENHNLDLCDIIVDMENGSVRWG